MVGMAMVKKIWTYLNARKRYWLLPTLIVVSLLGGLLASGRGSPWTPFLYSIF